MRSFKHNGSGILSLTILGLLAVAATAWTQPVARPSLGVRGRYTPQGMFVQTVTPGSAADKAGLQTGDLIQKIDGRAIQTDDDLAAVLETSGGAVVLSVRKANGRVGQVNLDLGRQVIRPGAWRPQPGSTPGGAGGHVLPIPLGIRGRYTADGMLVQTVTPGSPADVAGILSGDCVVKIDGRVIRSDDDLAAVLDTSGGGVVLSVRRANGRLTPVTVDLGGSRRAGPRRGVAAPYHLGVIGNFRPDGMQIQAVIPNTPAERCGLKVGDSLVQIDRRLIRSQEDLFAALNDSGGEAVLGVRRAGAGRPVTLEVDLRVYNLGALGEFTPAGMRIRVVAPGTPAEQVGLQAGDVIVRVDNQPIRNQDDFDAAMRASGGSATLSVRKGLTGQPVAIVVDLINNPLGAWGESAGDGVRLTSVMRGAAADVIGLERGDLILRVDDERVRTQGDLLRALKESDGFVTLGVRKGATGRLVRIDVVLAR